VSGANREEFAQVDRLQTSMIEWIIIGALDLLVLLAFRGLGGFGAASAAFREWGCSASRLTGSTGSS
jgi:hypothetical protein